MVGSKIRIHKVLSQLPLFDELNDDELGDIAEPTAEIMVKRGEFAFQRGDYCGGFHVVVYGQVKLFFVSPPGGEKVVRILSAGQSFGEALMFLEKPYILSAQALIDTMLLHVPKEVVFAQIARDGRFARKMLTSLSRRLYSLMHDIEAYSLKSGSQRVIDYLLYSSRSDYGNMRHFESSKATIASRLNLTPEHFSRILHGLSASRLISVKGRAITILNAEGLRGYQGRALP
ncbi:MAG: Crp/Fnr family transcriptional regulator [Burkholderiaceae bacterium]